MLPSRRHFVPQLRVITWPPETLERSAVNFSPDLGPSSGSVESSIPNWPSPLARIYPQSPRPMQQPSFSIANHCRTSDDDLLEIKARRKRLGQRPRAAEHPPRQPLARIFPACRRQSREAVWGVRLGARGL